VNTLFVYYLLFILRLPVCRASLAVQVLYFLEPIRCAMQKHLCSKEFCLACELGLLFRMLDHSEGESCQASNFLRAFRTLREASALGLLLNWENEENKMDLGKLIQSWTRFVLQQLNQETDPQAQPPPLPTQVPATPTSGTGIPPTPSFKMLTPGTPTTPMLQLGVGSFLDSGATGGFGTLGNEPTPPKGGVSAVEQLFGSTVKTVGKCGCGWSTVTERAELLFSLHYPHNLGRLVWYGDIIFPGELGYMYRVSVEMLRSDIELCQSECCRHASTSHQENWTGFVVAKVWNREVTIQCSMLAWGSCSSVWFDGQKFSHDECTK